MFTIGLDVQTSKYLHEHIEVGMVECKQTNKYSWNPNNGEFHSTFNMESILYTNNTLLVMAIFYKHANRYSEKRIRQNNN